MNTTELKANAYDLIAKMEAHYAEIKKIQTELADINQKIANASEERESTPSEEV